MFTPFFQKPSALPSLTSFFILKRFLHPLQTKGLNLAYARYYCFAICLLVGIVSTDLGYAAGVLSDQTQGSVPTREVIKSEAGVIPPEGGDKDERLLTGTGQALHPEIERLAAVGSHERKRLLQKTIKDMDAYRLMLKNIDAHNDDYSRVLLVEEADKYVEKFVDPILKNQISRLPEMFNLIAVLKFFKASIFYESGNYDKYREILKDMEKEYGKRHLSVALFASNKEVAQYKEMLKDKYKEILKDRKAGKKGQDDKHLSVVTSRSDEGFNTIGEAIEALESRLSKKKWTPNKL